MDVEVEQRVEKHVFGGQPRHVAPHVGRDGLDLGVALFRIGVAQIVGRDAVAAEPGADAAGGPVGEIQALSAGSRRRMRMIARASCAVSQ